MTGCYIALVFTRDGLRRQSPVPITWATYIMSLASSSLTTMPLLRKKDPHSIPPVSAPVPGVNRSYLPSNYSGSYRSSSSATYVASRDSDPYNESPMNRSSHVAKYSTTEGEDQYATDRYPHSRGVPDAYARGEASLEQDRNALLSGYKPQKPTGGSGRFFNSHDTEYSKAGEEAEEDIEGIKQQTQFMKQESVKTTRNAIRMAREAEETAMNTLGRLGDQSGMFEFCLITAFLNDSM